MNLTKKLLGYLHRVFDKDPVAFLALRLRYAGTGMTWSISDGVLTTTVTGGAGASLTVQLADYTVSSLVNFLAAQSGYTVEYANTSELSQLSARVLLDADGDQDVSNGDHLRGYTSLLWAYLEPFSVELKEADHQIDEALVQMNMLAAEANWLDEWGGYYGIPRITGELDPVYANRIIVEVLRPRGNNIAIEAVARELLGQPVIVNDVRLWTPTLPIHDGASDHDSTEFYDAAETPIYGLFDVDYIYNLESGDDVSEYAIKLAAIVEKMRDAGTHLRAMNLQSSQLSDTATIEPTDSASISITYGVMHNSLITYSSLTTYSGISTAGESLS
jgi:hypothetical protein